MNEGSTLREGRYRLEAVVGRGGMAIVWRARDLQLDRHVAIKVISDVLAVDPLFVARFEREARLAAGLNHPNLVKVFDFSTEDERPFLVMEYIPGGTLAEARQDRLDLEALARGLLDALAHMHAAGILHRDVKPSNVLLGADGSPRLTDFGIARGDETSGLTQTGQVLGTLRYSAPEVAAGRPATVQSDLYSLGIMLGEIHGRPPDWLSHLLPRLAAQDPAERPASAADALAELQPTRPLADAAGTAPIEPVTAPIPRADPAAAMDPAGGRASVAHPRRPRAPVPRNQAIAAAALLVAVLVVIVVATTGGGSSPNPARAQRPPRVAPSGAPVTQQVDQLEKLVQSLPAR